MKFKIGDRVKLAPGEMWNMGKRKGTVVAFQYDCNKCITFVMVRYKGYEIDTSQDGFPFKACEIVPVAQIGEQLLFDFMKGE